MDYLTILIICIVIVTTITKISAEINDNYAVVLDCGSTGSRAFVFRILTYTETNSRKITSIQGGKVRPGLSTFSKELEKVSSYLEPLIANTTEFVPIEKQKNTILYIRGTAGMRLLTDSEQKNIWNSLATGLKRSRTIPYVVNTNNFGTITGHMEAFYAVLASNYIAGCIDTYSRPIVGKELIGALDMGGGSTQLIFYDHIPGMTEVLEESHFWSHSWLNYGVETVRDRVYRYLYDNNLDAEKVDGKVYLNNPCGNKNSMYDYDEETVLVGTGNSTECVTAIEKLLWPNEKCQVEEACAIDGIVHPSVRGQHFYAMSVYYFAFDCIRHLGPVDIVNWPTPTIRELKSAVEEFCALSWDELADRMQANRHQFTRTSQLPNRCIEGLYLVTLLQDGFGFDVDDRRITYALEVEGHEVEWTLGYTLAEVVNAIETSSSTADTMRTMNSEKTEVGEILRKEFETIKNTFYNLKVRLYQVFSNILVRVGLKKY